MARRPRRHAPLMTTGEWLMTAAFVLAAIWLVMMALAATTG